MRILVSRARTILAVLSCLPLVAQGTQDVQAKIGVLEQQVQSIFRLQKPQLAVSPAARDRLARCNEHLRTGEPWQGDHPEAIPHLRSALDLEPDLLRIEELWGIAEERTGNARDAQNHLEHTLSQLGKKNQIEAGLELIQLYSAASQFEKALPVATKLQELAPPNPRILLVGYEISRRIMDQSLLTLTIAAPDSGEMHLMTASELGRQGDHAASVAQYREALKLNPSLPGAHFELAEQLRTLSDPALNAQSEQKY